ncbi:MAG: DUF616 domain-containing protein, partial [Bacilli bacterium]|nr:DUF616 domain-containing protein [Bacilli bacterium]
IRQHNNPNIIKIDCIWWNIYQQFSNRDQLSLFYVFWKLKFVPELIFSPTLNSHNLKGITFKVHKQLTLKNRVKRRFQCYYNRLKLVFSKEFNG